MDKNQSIFMILLLFIGVICSVIFDLNRFIWFLSGMALITLLEVFVCNSLNNKGDEEKQ